MQLSLISETATTITLGWTPVPGCIGYRFTREKAPQVPIPSGGTRRLYSHTYDPLRDRVTFSKDSEWYEVEPLLAGEKGVYPSSQPPPQTLPEIITQGGTYSGTRSGMVRVRTTEPVVIENSLIENSGTGFVLDANHAGVQLSVRHTTLKGGTGQALYSRGFKSIAVERCTVDKTWGIRLDAGQAGSRILVTRSRFRNQIFDASTNGNSFWLSHPFQSADNLDCASIEVSWNELVQEFGLSQCEDIISLYNTAGAKVHDNYISGAYPATVGGGYSGGGIIVDGNRGHDNEIYDNIVVDTVNYGLAIAGGDRNTIRNNRAVFDGNNDAGQRFAAANIGIYIADFSNDPDMSGNQAFANVVGWTKADGARNDWWLPKCQGQCSNSSLKSGAVTHADELAERDRWLAKLAAAGITVGA